MQKYQKIAYLLGCYMVISDKEINAFEVEVLEKYFPFAPTDELYTQRHLIFSDAEEKPDLSSLLSDLKLINTTIQQKQEIVRILADIAFGDDYMATQEKALLLDVAKSLKIDANVIIEESKKKSEERIATSRLSDTEKVIGKFVNFIYNLIPGKKKENTINLLLGNLGYSTSIEKITDNAIVDLERVSKIVDGINHSLIATNESLNSLKFEDKNNSKEVNEVAKTVSNIKTHFDNLIKTSLQENLEVLNKKRRNIRYFTIAFMGRTKAGKSTLHKVITQQENDDIGIGKLRTTRYNRSWYWNKLRIVDTPGIGAPGGATDTEIAKSIIDEADVICYIVTSDSIQETEFDFFETIKERNKPLYIVLNIKSNLTQSIRLKRFLENPTAWKECSGPQSIQGHIDRIHERLDGKYNMDAVEIIPIHLLAAQLGFSKECTKKTAKKLCEGSNIYTFTRSITAEVHKSGGIKKSLSVVDGTAYQIHHIELSILKDLEELQKGHDLLERKLEKLKSFMNNEKAKLIGDIKLTFEGTKKELMNRASAFAEENYDTKDAGKKWKEDKTVEKIYSEMKAQLQQRMKDYNEKVKDQIKEIAEDIQILSNFSSNDTISNISGDNINNTRLFAGIAGSILTAVAPFIIANFWNPAGWIVTLATVGVGMITSLFTSLFTSKAEKIKKAKDKMREQLCSNIKENIKDNQQKYLDNIQESLKKTTSAICELLSTYIDGTEKICNRIQELDSQCKEGESAINSLVSFRILEFVGKRIIKDGDIGTFDNNLLIKRYPVIRDWEQQSISYQYKVGLSAKDIDKINRATQIRILTN